MHRHKVVYLLISLTLVLSIFGALPLSAVAAPNAPVGVTETPTSAPTETPMPTEIPVQTETPVQTATPVQTETPVQTATPALTNTPVPTHDHPDVSTEENTATPTSTNTLVATPTITATAPAIVGFPNTGGGAPKSGAPSQILVLFAAAVGILGALMFGLRILAHRLARR